GPEERLGRGVLLVSEIVLHEQLHGRVGDELLGLVREQMASTAHEVADLAVGHSGVSRHAHVSKELELALVVLGDDEDRYLAASTSQLAHPVPIRRTHHLERLTEDGVDEPGVERSL